MKLKRNNNMKQGIKFYRNVTKEHIIIEIDGDQEILTPAKKNLVQDIYLCIKDDYPEAFNVLNTYFHGDKHRVVEQFIRCGFCSRRSQGHNKTTGAKKMTKQFCCINDASDTLGDIVCNPRFNTKFSQLQLDILQLIDEGYNEVQIAGFLHLRPFAIKWQRESIRQKLKLYMVDMLKKIKSKKASK